MHLDTGAVCAVVTLLLLILGGLARAVERLARIEAKLEHVQFMREDIEALQRGLQELREKLAGYGARIASLETTRQNSHGQRHHNERSADQYDRP